MSWKDLLNNGSERVLPWYGLRRIHDAVRSWVLSGPQPFEHGWYKVHTTGGRSAELQGRELQPIDPNWEGGQPKAYGYLVGDRLIPDTARVDPDPARLIEQTVVTYCVEPGLGRVARARVVLDREQNAIYMAQEFPLGPEAEVIKAYQDRAKSVDKIHGVTPALDLAFRFLSYDRLMKEQRREAVRKLLEEEEKKRVEKEKVERLMKDVGTAIGRRALAIKDFETAAREALKVSGAELLDARASHNKGEMVVQYRFEKRRLECVVNKATLRVIDAGVCLTDHATNRKDDTLFTLESLPGVIAEAMRRRKLVVWRHVDKDDDGEEIDWY